MSVFNSVFKQLNRADMKSATRRVDCSHIIALFQNQPERGNLYLSSVGMLNEYEEIKLRKIDCIVSVLDDWAWNKFQVKQKVEHMGTSVHHRIDLEDDEQQTIYPSIQPFIEFLRNNLAKTNVLVHCQAGVSRSPSFVIAFLMKELKMSYEQARKYTRQRRRYVQPNGTFQRQLIEWEGTLKKEAQK